MGRRVALLIATYEYQDADLRELTAPAHDAEAFAAVLRDPAIAGFEVTTLVNEAHHRVGEAIAELYHDRRRDDLALLYFTGHGLKDDHGRLYLAMNNTRRDNLLFTGLSAVQVHEAMDGCVSRQMVLILDCCYSGAFPAGRLAKADTAVGTLERFQGRGRTVLTASDATQYSFEGNQLHGQAQQSVFTRHLVAGLRDGSADLDGDGNITLDELYSYVHDRVVEEVPQQRPKRLDNVEGRTVIARNVNWTLPEHLRDALNSPIAAYRLGALSGLAHLHHIGNDAVRDHAVEEIRRLTGDDSKQVAAAAKAQLDKIRGEAPGEPSDGQADQISPQVPPDEDDPRAADPAVFPLPNYVHMVVMLVAVMMFVPTAGCIVGFAGASVPTFIAGLTYVGLGVSVVMFGAGIYLGRTRLPRLVVDASGITLERWLTMVHFPWATLSEVTIKKRVRVYADAESTTTSPPTFWRLEALPTGSGLDIDADHAPFWSEDEGAFHIVSFPARPHTTIPNAVGIALLRHGGPRWKGIDRKPEPG